MTDDPTARARADAAERGLEIEVRERPPARSLAEAAAGLGVEQAALVKTLVVRRGDDDHLFVLVPGDRTISWPRLREAVGANRLSMPDASVARAATGYERGTITPLGSTTAWPVYADSRIGGRIALGSGSHGHGVLVDAAALLTALDATVVDLSD
ncbi:aminoacyl-tRNA deacylase [Solicola sp. PLA-1-18]|uniref:aminoacyl-tRNA deacylase n=1 Tax=Solicola sp. PLA-1-18 TaxID=3380532 RepID=UPI003B77D7BF